MFPALGYSVRPQDGLVVTDESSVSGVEVTLETVDHPACVRRYLGAAEFDLVSLHVSGISAGNPQPPSAPALDHLQAIAELNGVTTVTTRLWPSPTSNLGLANGSEEPAATSVLIDDASRQVEQLQARLRSCTVMLDTAAQVASGVGLPDALGLQRLLQRTEAGWVIDLADLFVQSQGANGEVKQWLAAVLPAAPRVQIRLDGVGRRADHGAWRRQSDQPVAEPIWDLYQFVLSEVGERVEGVFLTRELNMPDESTWRGELRRIRRLAELVLYSRRLRAAAAVCGDGSSVKGQAPTVAKSLVGFATTSNERVS